MKNVKLFVLVGAVVSALACGGKVQDTDARTSDAGEGSIDSGSADDSSAGGGSATMPTEAVGGSPASSGTSSGGHVTAIEAGTAGSLEESGGSGVAGGTTIPDVGVGGSVVGVGGTKSVGGSDASAGETSTAGSAGVEAGGSTSVDCVPELLVEYVSHTSETVSPGANDFATLTMNLTAVCETMDVENIGFHIAAVDDASNDEAYYRNNDVENFTDVKLVDESTGQVLAGPATPRAYTSNEPANIILVESFTLIADTPTSLTVKLDVSSDFTAPTNTRYTVYFNGVNTSLNVPITVQDGENFLLDHQAWPAFMVSVPPEPKLVVRSSGGLIDAMRIVTPTTEDEGEIVADYTVTNEGSAPGRIGTISYSQYLPSGDLTDCERVDLEIDGTVCARTDTSSETTVMVEVRNTDCVSEIQPGQMSNLFLRCYVADPVATEEPEGPKSGDVFGLEVTHITADVGTDAMIDGRVEGELPPPRVLRKAQPVVTIASLTVLENARTNLFQFTIEPDRVDHSFDLSEFILGYTKPSNVEILNLRVLRDGVDMFEGARDAYVITNDYRSDLLSGLTSGYIGVVSMHEIIQGSVTYTIDGEVSGAVAGDVVTIGFKQSSVADSERAVITGYTCASGGGYFHVLIDSLGNQCLGTMNEAWSGQGDFLWSDMSSSLHEPTANTPDWTDDYLVHSTFGVTTLTY